MQCNRTCLQRLWHVILLLERTTKTSDGVSDDEYQWRRRSAPAHRCEGIGKVLQNDLKKNAKQYALHNRVHKQEQRKGLLDAWMLQRFKKILGDQLPKKQDNIVFCKLASEQQACSLVITPAHHATRALTWQGCRARYPSPQPVGLSG